MNIPSIKDNPIFYLGLLVTIEEGISGGTIKLAHAIPDSWIPVVDAWASILAFCGTAIMTGLAAPMGKPPTSMVAKVLAWLIMPLAFVLLMGSTAGAQGTAQPKRAAGPAQGSQEQQGLIFNNQEKPVQNAPCDFNLLGALQARNLMDQLKICVAAKGADDVQAALDSATAAGDKTAIACHTPALAIFKAAEGVSMPLPADAPAGTAPTIKPSGPILLFQKFREFVLAGGITNCKAWVITTLAAGAPIQ